MQYTLNIAFCNTDHYLPLAQCADECGWDSVSVADGLFYYQDVTDTEFVRGGEAAHR